MLTRNWRDFLYLHRSMAPHFGLALIKQDPDLRACADRIDLALRSVDATANRLIKVYRDRFECSE